MAPAHARRRVKRRAPGAWGAPCSACSAVLAARLGDSRGEMCTVSIFLGERVGPKTQKQGGVNLTYICKIRFLMAGTQRLLPVRRDFRSPMYVRGM